MWASPNPAGLLVGIAVEFQIPRGHREDAVGDLDEVAA